MPSQRALRNLRLCVLLQAICIFFLACRVWAITQILYQFSELFQLFSQRIESLSETDDSILHALNEFYELLVVLVPFSA